MPTGWRTLMATQHHYRFLQVPGVVEALAV